MVHILLVILKFIGILLASILGLLLLFLLIILLAPFGYQAAGEAGAGKNRFQANISWLYVVLRGKIVYDEEGIHWYVRLFGILFASSDEEFQKKQAEKAEKRKKKKAAKAAAKKKKEAGKKIAAKKQKKETKKVNKEEKESQVLLERKEEKESQVLLERKEEQESESLIGNKEKIQLESLTEHKKESERGTGLEEKPENQIESENKYLQSNQNEELKKSRKAENDWKTSWKTAWNSLLEKLLIIKKRAADFYTKWKNRLLMIPKKLGSIRQSLDNKLEKLESIKEFWKREETQDAKNRLIRDGKKVMFHILPRRFRGHIEFGLEDPYLMGQILAALGMLMPLYQDKLMVVPDFEESKLIGSFYLKGRIIPGYLLIKGAALLLNKNIRKTIKEGKQLIGGN